MDGPILISENFAFKLSNFNMLIAKTLRKRLKCTLHGDEFCHFNERSNLTIFTLNSMIAVQWF